MQSCLGLYIEHNLIKYAKVSKNNDTLKVESFGVKFFDNLSIAIKQIIEETYSFKTPISINTTEEIYNDLEVFSLLTKKDMESVIKTEFESICYEKEINKNAFEQRQLIPNAAQGAGSEKVKVIHVALLKTFIEQRKNQFIDYKLTNLVPTSVSIGNLIGKAKKETSLIVNIEKNTMLTKIKDSELSQVTVLDIGADEILSKINRKENSYSKAYEICKNATIYTDTDRDLQYEDNEYLEDIMPTVFQIASKIREYISRSVETIDKIYITGTGAVINNIDIYFQDYLNNIPCEILRPDFVSNNSKINIKDYIEVNSAISIAKYALEKDSNSINFLKDTGANGGLLKLLTSDTSDVKLSDFSQAFGEIFQKYRKQYTVISTVCVVAFITYIALTTVISNYLDNKIMKTEESIVDSREKIDTIEEYTKKFTSLKTQYETLINNLNDINNANSEDKRFKNTIPNLLGRIMVVIPKSVQLISIENTTDTHIVIKAKSTNYEDMAFFKTILKTEKVLKEVVSDVGTTERGYLTVTIEGELP